jgi:hypothetical protein
MQYVRSNTCIISLSRVRCADHRLGAFDHGVGDRKRGAVQAGQRSRTRPRSGELEQLENGMRRIPVLIVAAGLAASAVGAQTPSDSAASKSALLTLDQKTKISEMITERTPPLEGGSFPVSVDGLVPSDVQLNSLPSAAEQLAPQLRGFSYVVVEELVAIVDPRTRKVEIVFPRWGQQ